MTTRASIPSAWSAPFVSYVDRPTRVSGRRQHDHPATGPQRVPAEVRGHDAPERACAIAQAQDARDHRVARADAPRVERRHPRDVPERHAARTARDRSRSSASPRRRGCSSAKDVSNLSLAEAATIAGVIQSPSALSPFNNPDRCRERRNVVLQAMADEGYITPESQNAPRMSRWSWCSGRSKPRRRTSSTSSGRRSPRLSRPHDDDEPGGRCVHDARPAPAAAGAGRGARRPARTSTSCWPAGGAKARRRRR